MQFGLLFGAVLLQVLLLALHGCESALPPQDPSSRDAKQNEKTPITLDDILASRFSASLGFAGSWSPTDDAKIRVTSGNGGIIEYDMSSPESNGTILVNGSRFEGFLDGKAYSSSSLSADEEFILLEYDRNSVWRHSFLAKYKICDKTITNCTKLEPLPGEVPANPDDLWIQLVRWSPQGHSLAFVFSNNLYYRANDGTIQKLTDDGSPGIFNGIADWVYEEEMFGSPQAFWFSTDSSSLAFVQFDDTKVEEYKWPVYGEPGVKNDSYPTYEPIRYPKAGYDNPTVSAFIVELKDSFLPKKLQYPAGQDSKLHEYISTAIWTSPSQLLIINLNRHQNQSAWNLCESSTSTCKEIYTFEQANGWVDVHTPLVSKDGTRLITVEPVKQAQFNNVSYTQIVEVKTDGSTEKAEPLTSGKMSIVSFIKWDEDTNTMYFTASGWEVKTVAADPSATHVYSIKHPSIAGKQAESMKCLTCGYKNNANEECKSNSISFSLNSTYITHICRGPGIPEVITKKSTDMSVVKVWNDNKDLRDRLALKQIPRYEDLEIMLSSGYAAKVRLYTPVNFDTSKKYPLLVDVYGGPDSQKITQDFKVDWGTSVTSDKGILYASIDGRGSAKQSDDLKFQVYRNLGSAEIEDQIEATKKLIQLKNFIDANKTAIWGWSYGGYAAAMALGKDSENVFKCGVSVAPVTSWLYYDTIYTERYMGLPESDDNLANYDASAVMSHLENFKSKQFLLIHGNADDNVHYQQSMMLAKSLERADIMFSQLSYPDENHGIGGPGMRRHLYHSIERFLAKECLFEDPRQEKSSGNRSVSSNIHVSFIAIFSVIYSVLHF